MTFLVHLSKFVVASTFFVLFAEDCTQETPRSKLNQEAYRAFSHHFDYPAAERLYRAAIDQARDFGVEDEDCLESLLGLIKVLRAEVKYSETQPLFEEALAITERWYGPRSSEAAFALIALAEFQRDQCEFSKAECTLKRAAEISAEAIREERPVRNSLSFASMRVIRITPRRGGLTTSLADIYAIQGKYAEAEKLLTKHISAMDRGANERSPLAESFGDGTMTVGLAEGLTDLAVLYIAQDRPYEAEPLLRRALEPILFRFGRPQGFYFDPVPRRENLALALFLQDQPAESRLELEKALAIRRDRVKSRSPALQQIRERSRTASVAIARLNTAKGNEYFEAGKLHEAAECFYKAYDSISDAFGPDDVAVAEALESYCTTLRKLNRSMEAEFWDLRAAEISRPTAKNAD